MTTYENGDPIITIMPISVLLDHRLTLIQTRVLAAIFSFRNKETGMASIKRETIAIRCGYSNRTISEATTQLERLGWLVKSGKGGFSKASEFRVTVPDLGTVLESETVPDVGTVPDLGTVPESTSTTVPDPASKTVPDPGTGKEQSINKVRTEICEPEKFSASQFLKSLGADKDLIAEWMKVRKVKKCVNTKTALEDFAAEVTKSGKPINDVIRQCVKRSWGGFNASWKWSSTASDVEPVRLRRVLG
jgi:Helix-turn-helix domain